MSSQPTLRKLVLAAVAVLLAAGAKAQYDLSWLTIDGGGVMHSSGGAFSVGATIGQADAASAPALTGGQYALVGGFWAVAAGGCTLPGDLDVDGDVDQADLGILLSAFGTCPGEPFYHQGAGGLAGDPCVTQTDLGVLLATYGQACP
jgi:hypothetical protein